MSTLRDIRESKGVKQVAVAQHLGISTPTYRKYENNPSSMSIDQARAVSEFLSCPMEDIFLSEDVEKVNL